MLSHFPNLRERAATLNELEYHGLPRLRENGGRLLDKDGNDHSDLLGATEQETRARIDELRKPLLSLLSGDREALDRFRQNDGVNVAL